MHLIGRAIDFKVRDRSIQNLEGLQKNSLLVVLAFIQALFILIRDLIVAGGPNLKVD